MSMNRFEWTSARTVAEAATAGAVNVADAMLAPPDAAPGQAVVLKAGGIDLLDLMKERLLAPRRLVNLRAIPGLDAIDPPEPAPPSPGQGRAGQAP